MKYKAAVLVLIVGLTCFAIPLHALAGVKVFLKNGREIIADGCRHTNGKLVCEMMGGSFEFDKAEISKIENVTTERRRTTREAVSDTSPSDQNKDELNDGGNGKPGEKTNAEQQTGGLTREQEKRLAGLRAKRTGLEADREKLMQEREQLREEVKAAGLFKSKEKYDDLQKKIDAMDERIKTFNDQVNKLNEEISSLTNESGEKTQ